MGYYVRTIECDIRIPKEKLGEGYRLACELNAREDLKTGGCWPGGHAKPADSKSLAQSPDMWFSWMPWNYDEIAESLTDILDMLGFHYEVEPNGDIVLQYFDQKKGAEEDFLNALAPVVTDGGMVVWLGEDDNAWVDRFSGGLMTNDFVNW